MRNRAITLAMMLCLSTLLVLVVTQMPAQPPTDDKVPNVTAAVKEAVPATPVPGVKTVASRVTAVTVYPNSALVTREVEVPAGTGTVELVVTPLPPQTINSSLYTEGPTASAC